MQKNQSASTEALLVYFAKQSASTEATSLFMIHKNLIFKLIIGVLGFWGLVGGLLPDNR